MYVKSKVTSKYQITLPKNIRKKLGIERGDAIIFEGKGDKVFVKAEKRFDPVEAIEGLLEGEDIEKLKAEAVAKMLQKKLGLK